MRVEDAFPAIVARYEFDQVQRLLKSRAPKQVNPRRFSSRYLLSGLARCDPCGKSLTALEAKSGKYTYYVCQSEIKRGSETCETPRLNAPKFEKLSIDRLRDHILTERNIRELVKLVDEDMDALAREQRDKLPTIKQELGEVKRALDRIWRVIETTDLEVADAAERIREHKQRKEQLELVVNDTHRTLAERRQLLDSADVMAELARDMSQFLVTSDIMETKAFTCSFVKGITVRPGRAVIRYTKPMPGDSPIGRADAPDVVLNGGVMSSVGTGGPDRTRTRKRLSTRPIRPKSSPIHTYCRRGATLAKHPALRVASNHAAVFTYVVLAPNTEALTVKELIRLHCVASCDQSLDKSKETLGAVPRRGPGSVRRLVDPQPPPYSARQR